MAEKKRQCGTCRFFVEKEGSGHGKCTHPRRAGTDADLLLLRPNELACRTQWGDSLWQDPADDSDPMEPKTPQQPSLPEPIAAQLQFDDEVTSVSIAGSKSSRSSFEDDVVDSGATASGMASWNDPVQEERLDLLRKSSQDALAGARKRHMEKQNRQRELIPFAEDEGSDTAEPENKQEQDAQQSAAQKSADFPPDDFVEDERTTAEDDPFADELMDEGVAPDRHRSPRLRKLLRDPKNPKANEAMQYGSSSGMQVTSHNPENRDKWNTVPTLNPGFELEVSKPVASPKLAASAAPTLNSSNQARPVSQARELLSEDRLRQERAQRQLVAPLQDEHQEQERPEPVRSITNRARLTKAPAPQSETIENVKSSPLRGSYPAARKLGQQQPRDQQRAPQIPQRMREESETIRDRRPAPAPQQPFAYDASPKQQPRQRPQSEQQHRPQPSHRERPQYRADVAQPGRQEQQDSQQRRRPYIPLQQENQVRDMSPFRPLAIEIGEGIPKQCGTCTSYRPSEVPGRGSCGNAFAGPVQRVVYEEDLACQHTFGSFWLPQDELVWLDDLPDYSEPTPRVDRMLARKRRKENTVLPDLEELTS